jgi:hypothetical protein
VDTFSALKVTLFTMVPWSTSLRPQPLVDVEDIEHEIEVDRSSMKSRPCGRRVSSVDVHLVDVKKKGLRLVRGCR